MKRSQIDFTKGPLRQELILFSLPLIAGNLLQQLYNWVDTLIVGRFLGSVALAAVGSAYTLMVLLTSLLIGLCLGSGVVISQLHAGENDERMKLAMTNAFALIAVICLALFVLSRTFLPQLILLMRIPPEAVPDITAYLSAILTGLPFVFLYNYFASVMRAVGDSVVPLVFLFVSTVLNIALDLLFVLSFGLGTAGAAWATVAAQGVSALGIALYFARKMPRLHPARRHLRLERPLLSRIASSSVLTSIQQTVMNFGVLMIQSLVNSFGVQTMAAFAACCKIDSLAYAPATDFSNGYATCVAQNAGANKQERVLDSFRQATILSMTFCVLASLCVSIFAPQLLGCFIDPGEAETIAIGVRYLRIEGACYVGIGMLQLLYSTCRGLERAEMSILLTVISLGLRVLVSYTLAPFFGVLIIWISIPFGWLMADLTGLLVLRNVFGWWKVSKTE